MRYFIFITLLFIFSREGFTQQYDLIIKNGTLYTGSPSKAFIQASIAIKGNKIVNIAPKIKGIAKRVIDASGHIVSPGFIDLHAHLEPLTLDPEAKSHIMQGVTTALGGPDGGGPLPLADYLVLYEVIKTSSNIAFNVIMLAVGKLN